MMKKEQTVAPTMVAQINQVNIVSIGNGKKQVAIKPICKTLGMNEEAQRQKIQNNVLWSPMTLQRNAVGAHRKERDRGYIPIKYVLGRQFTINFSAEKGGLL